MDNIKKLEYTSPCIEIIELDNEIALQLQSAPPLGPGEVFMIDPNHFNNDPFGSNLA